MQSKKTLNRTGLAVPLKLAIDQEFGSILSGFSVHAPVMGQQPQPPTSMKKANKAELTSEELTQLRTDIVDHLLNSVWDDVVADFLDHLEPPTGHHWRWRPESIEEIRAGNYGTVEKELGPKNEVLVAERDGKGNFPVTFWTGGIVNHADYSLDCFEFAKASREKAEYLAEENNEEENHLVITPGEPVSHEEKERLGEGWVYCSRSGPSDDYPLEAEIRGHIESMVRQKLSSMIDTEEKS